MSLIFSVPSFTRPCAVPPRRSAAHCGIMGCLSMLIVVAAVGLGHSQTIPSYSKAATLNFNGQQLLASWLIDANGDGLTDVVGCFLNDTPPYTQELVLWEQNAGNGFSTAIDLGAQASCLQVDAGDINGDGYTDLIMPRTSGNTAGFTGTYEVLYGSPTGFVTPTVWSLFDAGGTGQVNPTARAAFYTSAASGNHVAQLYDFGLGQFLAAGPIPGNDPSTDTFAVGAGLHGRSLSGGVIGPDLEGKGYPSMILDGQSPIVVQTHDLAVTDNWVVPQGNLVYNDGGNTEPIAQEDSGFANEGAVPRKWSCIPVDINLGVSFGCVFYESFSKVAQQDWTLQYTSSTNLAVTSFGEVEPVITTVGGWSFPKVPATTPKTLFNVYPWNFNNGPDDIAVVNSDGNIYAGIHESAGVYAPPVVMASIPTGAYFLDAELGAKGLGLCYPDYFVVSDPILTSNSTILVPSSPGVQQVTAWLLGTNINVYTAAPYSCVGAQTLTLSSDANPSVWSQGVTFSCSVSGAGPKSTGTLTITADGVSLGSGPASTGATISTSTLAVGTHSISCSMTGESSPPPSVSLQQTVTKLPTGLQFTLNPNPSTVSNTFNIQIQVTAADGAIPTGTVSVVADGATTLGNPTLNGAGEASLGVNSLAVGQHTIVVSYPGSADYDSSSEQQTQTVNAIATNTTVVGNPASSTYLSCITFTATVTATEGTPTGSVSFAVKVGSNASVSLGSSSLNSSGVATVASCSLTPATYTVTASYGGAADFAPSSGTTNETVTTLTVPIIPPSPPSGGGPIHPGSPITIPIGGFPTPPGGISPTQPIEVTGGGTPIGTVPPSGGSITFTPPSIGPYPVGSCYPGDADYANTCPPTNPIIITVTGPTTLLVSASPDPTTFGQSAVVTAKVSSSYGTPTGSVSCSSDSGSLGTSTVSGSGTATLSTGIMAVGAHTINCNYTPSGYFDPSNGSGSETVIKATPTVTVSVSPEPTYPGDYATLTAVVSGVSAAQPTGTVTFLIDGKSAGSSALTSGTATFSAPFTTVGAHSVTAQYGGDGNYNPATGTYTHTVVKLPTTTLVSSTPNPGIGGQQVITLQSVTTFPDLQPGTLNERQPMTGTVTFSDGGTVLGTVAINSTTELAVLPVPSMTVGTHNLTASYSGDANYTNSASAAGAFAETLVPPVSGLNISGYNAAAVVSGNASWSAQVLNPLNQPQPNGTVTWSANGTVLGTSQVTNGATSFTTTFPVPGIYTVVAAYAGNQQPGTQTFSQTVLSTGPDGSAPFVMSAPGSVSMGEDGTAQVAVSFASAGLNTPVILTCTGAPAGYSCAVTPSSVTLTDTSKQPTVTASVTQTAQAQVMNKGTIAFAGFGFGMLGLIGILKRRKALTVLVFAVAMLLPSLILMGCGLLSQSSGPSSYSLAIKATSATYTQSVVVNINK